MSAIKGFQAGIETVGKERTEVFQTVQKTHLGRGLSNIVQHGAALLETIVSTVVSNVQSTVTLPANNARVGHILQNKTTGFEFNVIAVNGDVISLEVKKDLKVPIIGTAGDAFAVKQFVMSQLNADGAMDVVAQSGPLQFKLDAADTIVSEDSGVPANSIPLPTKILDDAGLNVALILEAIKTELTTQALIDAFYLDAGVTAVTAAGVTMGALSAAGKEMAFLNNANSVRIEIDGVLQGISLPGTPLILNVAPAAGNIVIKSLGADINGGDFAVNITG